MLVDSENGRGGRFSEFTLWPRIAGPLRRFLRTETGGALALLGATAAALLWANSPWSN